MEEQMKGLILSPQMIKLLQELGIVGVIIMKETKDATETPEPIQIYFS